jgi:hypothetical protein
MSKFFSLLITLYGVILLMSWAGIQTSNQDFLSHFDLLNTNNDEGLWGMATWVAALCVGAGVIVSVLTKTSPDLYIAGTLFGVSLVPLVATFNGVINYAHGLSEWVYYITFAIFTIMGSLYIVLGIDWVMNRGGN